MANKEKIISTSTIYNGKIIDVEVADIVTEKGLRAQREIVRHVPAVAIMAFDENNFIFLEKQWRVATNQFIFEIPAGKMDNRDGGDPLNTVSRELNEELRMGAKSISLVSEFYETVGFSDAYMYLFEARDLSDVENKLPQDETESLDVFSVSFEEMTQMVKDKKIIDSKTLLAYYYWKGQIQ